MGVWAYGGGAGNGFNHEEHRGHEEDTAERILTFNSKKYL